MPRFTPAALACAMLLVVLAAARCSQADGQHQTTPSTGLRILAVHPHDAEAFTQGLVFHEGLLYESTGQYGSSTVRSVDIDSGTVRRQERLPDNRFGEGLAKLGSSLLQLTWKAQQGFIYDLHTLAPLRTFRYSGQGWGIAASGPGRNAEKALVMSNGTAELIFLDTTTLQPLRTVTVRENGSEVAQLNELEWYGPWILANIWFRDEIAVIDPEDGTVRTRIDLAPLRTELPKAAGVANGIAYDPGTGRLYLTGKNWNKIFEVELTPEFLEK